MLPYYSQVKTEERFAKTILSCLLGYQCARALSIGDCISLHIIRAVICVEKAYFIMSILVTF